MALTSKHAVLLWAPNMIPTIAREIFVGSPLEHQEFNKWADNFPSFSAYTRFLESPRSALWVD